MCRHASQVRVPCAGMPTLVRSVRFILHLMSMAAAVVLFHMLGWQDCVLRVCAAGCVAGSCVRRGSAEDADDTTA